MRVLTAWMWAGRSVVAGAVLGWAIGAGAQSGASADAQAARGAGTAKETTLEFERDWPQQTVPFYALLVRPDGSGSFTTDRATKLTGVVAGAGDGSGVVAATPVANAANSVVPIHLSPKTVERLFAVQGAMHSAKGCQVGTRHLAQTGKKTLTLVDGGAPVSCTFNYSDDKRVEEAATTFASIAATLEERPVLEHLRRYDRLGLDAELGNFLESAKSGRAIELSNLTPLLQTLAADEALMDRVRSRVTELLAMAQAGS